MSLMSGTKSMVLAVSLLAGTAPVAAAPQPRTLTEANSGTTVTVRSGDTVLVSLAATLSAGFGWTLAKAAGVTQQGAPTVSAPAGGGAGHAVGGAQTQTFTLKITGRGKHVATFAYARPWEHVAPLKTVRFTIVAR